VVGELLLPKHNPLAIWTVICCSVRKSREKLREETSREGKIREVEVKGKVEVEADL